MLTRNTAPAVSPEGFLPGSTLDRRAGGDTLSRFVGGTYNSTARTVEAILSSGARVRRWGIYEELAVTPEAIDLGRANAGQLRLLDSHNQGSMTSVLGTVENVRIEGGNLIGLLRFAETDAGRVAEGMVARGEMTGISIGYRVTKWVLTMLDGDTEIWRAEAWELLEASLVAVPADPAAQTRSAGAAVLTPAPTETDDMRRNALSGDAPAPVAITTPVVETRSSPAQAAADVTAAAVAAERTRVRDLNDIATRSGLAADALARAIDAGTDVEAFRRTAFDHLAAQADQTRVGSAAPGRVIEDEREKLVEGATRGLLMRAGREGGERNEFTGMSLARLAEESLVRSGVKIQRRGLPMVGDAFQQRGGAHSSGDFPLILENVVNKSMLSGWDQADTTYQIWTKKGSLSDFKTASRYGVGPLPLLAKKAEGSKYEYASLGESKATVMLGTYGQMFAITRELVINDDMNALSDIPMKQGRAARLTVDMLPYALITANAAWQGGVALFHANRKNLAGAAAIPSAASFAAAAKAMRTGHNEGADGKTRLRIAAKYGLFPEALRFDVLKLLASGTELGQSNPNIVNPVKNFVEPVFSDWLDDASAASWYFAADKINDTVEVSFLDGNDSPFLDQQQGWTVDGTEFKVRIDAGASVLDPRGLYKNAGV